MKFGLYDRAEKALLHVFETHEEAETKRVEADIKTAVVVKLDEQDNAVAPSDPTGEPNEPQEEVTVHPTSGAPAADPEAPAADSPPDPEVAADVAA